jgi:hypothetical protein
MMQDELTTTMHEEFIGGESKVSNDLTSYPWTESGSS